MLWIPKGKMRLLAFSDYFSCHDIYTYVTATPMCPLCHTRRSMHHHTMDLSEMPLIHTQVRNNIIDSIPHNI
jgi:hypothetical protein